MKTNYFTILFVVIFCLALTSCNSSKSGKYKKVEQLKPLEEVVDEFKLFPRSDWTDEGPDESKIAAMTSIFRITIHHTAMPDDELPDLGGDSKTRMQKILMWHKQHNGWADVGYHYVIDPEGKVWEGRNIKYQGAHAGNEEFNVGNIGVVLMGNFDEHPLPEAQCQGLVDFVHFLKKKYKIESKNVFGHVHFRDTKCPGKNIMSIVERLRKENSGQ